MIRKGLVLVAGIAFVAVATSAGASESSAKTVLPLEKSPPETWRGAAESTPEILLAKGFEAPAVGRNGRRASEAIGKKKKNKKRFSGSRAARRASEAIGRNANKKKKGGATEAVGRRR